MKSKYILSYYVSLGWHTAAFVLHLRSLQTDLFPSLSSEKILSKVCRCAHCHTCYILTARTAESGSKCVKLNTTTSRALNETFHFYLLFYCAMAAQIQSCNTAIPSATPIYLLDRRGVSVLPMHQSQVEENTLSCM